MWSLDRHLLAGVIDELRAVQYVIAAGNGAKGLRPPKPIPRPGTRAQRSRPPSIQDVRARLTERGIHIPDELLGR